MNEKVLIVDDDERILQTFGRHLRLKGYTVLTAASGSEALVLFSQEQPEVVFADVRMPPPDGFALLQVIRENKTDAEVILITGHGDMELAVNALRAGASDFIPKPIESNELEAALYRVQERLRLKRELHAAQDALFQYAADLEIRNVDLDTFNTAVAHDLKQPINLIITYLDKLKQHYPATEEAQKYWHALARNGRKMCLIIDELQLFSQLRQTEVDLRPLDMARIVAEVQQRLAHLITQYDAKLSVPTDWPKALGHTLWVEEVWANYISNAIEYGGRPPRLKLGATARSDGLVRFWVHDNGPGLTPEEQVLLLAPASQPNPAEPTDRRMGLSIVRRIVEKLGGQVWVESEGQPGQGSTFSFSLKRVRNTDFDLP